jgi:hypothetical protein
MVWKCTVKISVADPDPGSSVFLTPGSGMGKNPLPGSEIRDEHPGSFFESLYQFFCVSNIPEFFNADPGWEKIGSGINIPDPQH